MTTTKPAPLALTRDEAAAAVGLTKDRIDRAIRTGALKAKKIGRAVRIRPADLEAWLDAQDDA